MYTNTVTSGVSEHWKVQQEFYMENGTETEKSELFKADFYRQVMHKLLGFDLRGRDGQGICVLERLLYGWHVWMH